MRRTSPAVLVVAAVLGVGAGFTLDQILTATGRATFTPAVALPVLLVGLGVGVIALAWPVRRSIRGTAAPVDPFQALRIAVLARASSIVGAVCAGFAGGLGLFLATRPVPPSLGSVAPVLSTVAGGLVLVAAALVAEHFCTLRKDDDDDRPGPAEPGPADPVPDRSA